MSTKDYKAIADVLRKLHQRETMGQDVWVADVALELCKLFNDRHIGYPFKPLVFMDACSVNPDLYPFSELWVDDAVEQT